MGQRIKGDSQELNVLQVKPDMVPISLSATKGLESLRIEMGIPLIDDHWCHHLRGVTIY